MLSGSLARIRFERDAISRLYSELSKFEQTTVNDSEAISTSTQNPFHNLILDKVSFRYPDTTQDALKEITLEIRTGESIGLIGISGSGKTTLVDLLLGLVDPYEGEITYNGRQMNKSLNEWRSHVAYLPQQVFLIDNTLRQNVALGYDKDEIDDLKIHEALRKARLSDLVKQLPRGIDTMLGERGVRLSGGQRQRVALARAFYHERNILVMDESTSALDQETENEIIAEIQQLKGEKTMIVIAHRLTTVQNCDRIYRLDQGRIVEQGSPEEILNHKVV
jgi:ABC-type bacteriocin/lantibiotic exporter with double-glycine peptidase domain